MRSVVTVLGNISGLFLMSLCSVLGLGTLILYSTGTFVVIKVLGAAYLVYLGVKLWLHGVSRTDAASGTIRRAGPLLLYRQGLLVALTNPKAIIFTTALFPQFVVPSQPLAGQFTLLVATFMSFSFLCLVAYAFASHTVKQHTRPWLSARATGRLFGGVFVLAGAALATVSRK
jgi:threonine/homoserine/homoserine lactone efflux protein